FWKPALAHARQWEFSQNEKTTPNPPPKEEHRKAAPRRGSSSRDSLLPETTSRSEQPECLTAPPRLPDSISVKTKRNSRTYSDQTCSKPGCNWPPASRSPAGSPGLSH